MLIHNQERSSILHISQIAKGRQNDGVDSHTIRKENLLRLIQEVGGKTVDLAHRTGANPSHLSQITSAKGTRNVGPRLARQLEKGMGKPRGWMDVPHSKDMASAHDQIPVLWVPIISWSDAGNPDRAAKARGPAVKIPTAAIMGGRRLSEKCFGLQVTGDSMVNPMGRPTYPPGCTIIVDPERTPENGERVIVSVPGVNEPTFKVYTLDSGRVFLRSLNPQYPSLAWQDGMKILGVVVQTVIEG